MTDTQSSRLLSELFRRVGSSSPLAVLNLGPAVPETVNFFSQFRCKLHIADLSRELPLRADPEAQQSLRQRMEQALALPGAVFFDLCLFWDVLNYLDREAIAALMDNLRPQLHSDSFAHCFAPHSSRTPASDCYYGISDEQSFSVRRRAAPLPDYQPHPQGELIPMLGIFEVDRSTLLPDRRIELLLRSRASA